ncbi:MAG: type II toxin-antitoxin system HicB family antitoxin [Acidobacteriota bacterium]
MSTGDRYVKLIEWSDEDKCFIGSCPELFYGGCHGENAKAVFAELCEIVKDTIDLYEREGRSLPTPMSGRDLVNALQGIA